MTPVGADDGAPDGVPDGATDGVCGGCLCGAVTFVATGPLRPVIACHCNQCRKTSGNFVTATAARRENVQIAGDVTWFQSSAQARRGFCGTCGSNLFWDGADDQLSIFAGVLEAPTGLQLIGHIYCAQKGDYYEIADGTPQFPGDEANITGGPVGGSQTT